MENEWSSKHPLPKEPTHHMPGTKGKIEVMKMRHERGEAIFHPEDANLQKENEDGTI